MNSGELAPVREGVSRLLISERRSLQLRPELQTLMPTVLDYLSTEAAAHTRSALERIISNIIAILRSLAQRTHLVLAIDDIDWADPATILFLERLSSRASEIALTVVLTKQLNEPPLEWIDNIAANLGTDLHCTHVTPLSAQESATLAALLETQSERQHSILRLSGDRKSTRLNSSHI